MPNWSISKRLPESPLLCHPRRPMHLRTLMPHHIGLQQLRYHVCKSIDHRENKRNWHLCSPTNQVWNHCWFPSKIWLMPSHWVSASSSGMADVPRSWNPSSMKDASKDRAWYIVCASIEGDWRSAGIVLWSLRERSGNSDRANSR